MVEKKATEEMSSMSNVFMSMDNQNFLRDKPITQPNSVQKPINTIVKKEEEITNP